MKLNHLLKYFFMISLHLLLIHHQVQALECQNPHEITHQKDLIFISIKCPHCHLFIQNYMKKKQHKPYLVFKETRPLDIRKYLVKHNFQSLSTCELTKDIKKQLGKNLSTPQIFSFAQLKKSTQKSLKDGSL